MTDLTGVGDPVRSRGDGRLAAAVVRGLTSVWLVVAVVALLFVVALTAAPFLITFDGHFYLSGSRVLFTDQAPDLFWWLRQPGYSVFLRTVASGLGPADLWFTALQAACVILGGLLAALVVWRSATGERRMPPIVLAVCLLVGVGNAGVLLYSSAALQQSLFVLATGLALMIAAGLQHRPSWWLLGSAVVLVVAVALVQKEYGQLMACVLALGVFVSSSSWWPAQRLRLPAMVGRLVTAAVIFVLLQLAVTAALLPWNSYRDEQVAKRSATAPVLPTALPSLLDDIEAATSRIEPHENGLISQFGGFVGLRGSTQFIGEPVERRVYVENRTNTGWNCGAVEGMPPEFQPVQATSISGIDITCRSVAAMELWGPWVHLSLDLYPYLLVAGLLAAAWQLVRWRMVLPAGAVLGLTTVYTVLGFGADRYSVPIFPAASSILVVTLVTAAGPWANRTRHPRRPDGA